MTDAQRDKRRTYYREWTARNRVAIRDRQRLYMREYRKQNKERLLARDRAHYWKNPDKWRDKVRAYRKRRHPAYATLLRRIQYLRHEKGKPIDKEYFRKWRKENARHCLEYRRQYDDKNRERVRERGRRYRNAHPELIRACAKNAKTRRRAATGKLSTDDLVRLKKRQKGKCYWCRNPYGNYHVDHVWPLAKGGTNEPYNVVLSCATCNLKKNAKTPIEFAGVLL